MTRAETPRNRVRACRKLPKSLPRWLRSWRMFDSRTPVHPHQLNQWVDYPSRSQIIQLRRWGRSLLNAQCQNRVPNPVHMRVGYAHNGRRNPQMWRTSLISKAVVHVRRAHDRVAAKRLHRKAARQRHRPICQRRQRTPRHSQWDWIPKPPPTTPTWMHSV